jgi:2-methylisocitrate lyase-like PEP mutase family enzyme
MADSTLKAAFARSDLVVAPGVYDMISARVADGLSLPPLYATGYGMVASHLGVADVGLATYTDMVGRAGQIARGCETPVIADADTGYGGILNVRHTVQGYESAGIAAIQIEDQEAPKKCRHTQGRSVIPAEDMVLKIEVGLEARRSDDFLVIARTDARTSLGPAEAIRRGKMYARAGADLIFVESPETEDELAHIGQEIDAKLVANMVPGGRTPILPAEGLRALGFKSCDLPRTRLSRCHGGIGARLQAPVPERRQLRSAGFRQLRLRAHVRTNGISGCLGLRPQMGGTAEGRAARRRKIIEQGTGDSR